MFLTLQEMWVIIHYTYPSVGTKAKLIKYGEAVEIVFQGTNIGNNHPMRLHGFSFYLVGTGYGNFDNVTSPQTFNLKDPPVVNTIGVPKRGWAVIRFVADNPGTNLSLSLSLCDMMAMLFRGLVYALPFGTACELRYIWTLYSILIVENGPTKETSIRPPPPNLPTCS